MKTLTTLSGESALIKSSITVHNYTKFPKNLWFLLRVPHMYAHFMFSEISLQRIYSAYERWISWCCDPLQPWILVQLHQCGSFIPARCAVIVHPYWYNPWTCLHDDKTPIHECILLLSDQSLGSTVTVERSTVSGGKHEWMSVNEVDQKAVLFGTALKIWFSPCLTLKNEQILV